MSVKFGTDGTLYCNTVKRNWSVSQNLIGYGCYGINLDSSSQKNWSAGTNFTDTFNNTTRAGCGFRINGDAVMSQYIYIPQPRYSSSYIYFSFYYCMPSYKDSSSDRIWVQLIDRTSGNRIDDWELPYSKDYTYFSTCTAIDIDDHYNLFISISSPTGAYEVEFTRLIMAEISYKTVSNPSYFNATGWKNWYDNYLRENRTYVVPDTSTGNLIKFSTTSGWRSAGKENDTGIYQGRSSYSYPECFWENDTSTSACYLFSSNTSLSHSANVYFQSYVNQVNAIKSSNTINRWGTQSTFTGDFTIPADYSNIIHDEFQKAWYMSSAYYNPSDSTITSVDFTLTQPSDDETACYSYWAYMCDVGTFLTRWNSINGSSLTQSSQGVNRQFLDCWVDGFSQPILHVPDPSIREIKFNTDYDVICSDIIIDPTVSKLWFDEAGRIHCKALILDNPNWPMV